MGPVLAKAVKSGLINADWLRSTVYDLQDVDQICAALPDVRWHDGETAYCPDGQSVILADFVMGDGSKATVAAFCAKKFGSVIVAPAIVYWNKAALLTLGGVRHIDSEANSQLVQPYAATFDEQLAKEIASLDGNASKAANALPAFLSLLFKADYARQVEQAPERRTAIGRAFKLPMYEIRRRTVEIDWFTYYQTNPACRQNLPAGVSTLPLHDVVQHWCERQLSGDPHCAHQWQFHDEHHKECTKCGRYSWFRDTFYRGDEKNGRIVHDYVTGKRYKVAA